MGGEKEGKIIGFGYLVIVVRYLFCWSFVIVFFVIWDSLFLLGLMARGC